jgi:dynactin complex subunit
MTQLSSPRNKNNANLNANSILAFLSNNNNINSLNGLDVNTLNAFLSSGVNANQIAALIGSGSNSQQISALLLNNNGNINNLGGHDIQLQQLLSDLGNGNFATGATNIANLLLQATSNNPVRMI